MEEEKQRTSRQNRSIHKYFSLLADNLNEAGLDQRVVLKPSIDIPWTPESVKSQLWKPFQNAVVNKESTTELTTKEVNEVYELLNRHLGEKFGVVQDFPHIDIDDTEE